MSFFRNLFGSKPHEFNINDLELKQSDAISTRASNILIGLGLRDNSNYLNLLGNVTQILGRYQELDTTASSDNIKKVLLETPVVKNPKKKTAARKPKSKKSDAIIIPLTDTTMTITPANSTKKTTKKRVYKRKVTSQKNS